MRLLDQYGASATEQAIIESLSRGVSHPHGVRQALECRREARDQPTPIPVDLKQHPEAKAVAVKPHDLALYDQLQNPTEQGDDNDE